MALKQCIDLLMHFLLLGTVPNAHPQMISLPGPMMHKQLLFPRVHPERFINQLQIRLAELVFSIRLHN